MILGTAWKNILHKPLNALLSWVLLTASVAIISLLLLLQDQFEQKFESSIAGVDLVLGAKGSPLQLILSSVYHIDNPTGNIDYAQAQKWMKHPFVAKAIPLAYGDSYQGFSIVGTTPEYLEKYEAAVAQGTVFQQDFEVVVGSNIARQLQIATGAEFYGTHGVSAGGEEHHAHAYRVMGILAPTGTVADNLILSNLESVWKMHEGHHHDEYEEDEAHHDEAHDKGEHHDEDEEVNGHQGEHESPSAPITKSANHREITAVLLKFRNPMGIVQWPRLIAQSTNMQVASPAIEVNRIFSLFGIGIQALTYLGWAIMGLSGLSVFIALYNTLKERRYELALMRAMGAGRGQLMWLVLLESLWLCLVGYVSGLLLSRFALWLISSAAEREYHFSFDQFGFRWPQEAWLLVLTLGIGVLAALIPALKAYSLNISKTLANE